MTLTRDQKIHLAYQACLGIAAFAVIAWKASWVVAAIMIACWVAGYMTEFALLRLAFARRRGEVVTMRSLLVAVVVIAGDAAIIAGGYGLVLGATFMTWLVIDALVLRFR